MISTQLQELRTTKTLMSTFSKSISIAKEPNCDLANTSRQPSKKNSMSLTSKPANWPLPMNTCQEKLSQWLPRMMSCWIIRVCFWMRSRIGKMPALAWKRKRINAQTKWLNGRKRLFILKSASKIWDKRSRYRMNWIKRFKTTAWTWRDIFSRPTMNWLRLDSPEMV